MYDFLSFEDVLEIYEDSLRAYGGTSGLGETAKSCNLTQLFVLECCAKVLPSALRRCEPAPAV